MISAQEAQDIVIRDTEGPPTTPKRTRFAIQSCVLSPRRDFWVIFANTAAYVLEGDGSQRLVGAGAYLVNVATGELDRTGSAQSWQDLLEDGYDTAQSAGQPYVLTPAFTRAEKASLINLHQQINCPLTQALQLVAEPTRPWLIGRRRILLVIQDELLQHGISCDVGLGQSAGDAVKIDDRLPPSWDELTAMLRARSAKTVSSPS